MSLSDSIYAIIANVIQTTERKDNKAVEKVGDPCGNLNVEEQPKDPRDNLRIIKRSIGPILNLDLDIDRLRKSFIVFKSSNLGVKIPENAFYIVTKNDIYIYSKDL